jgi:hypothetical protein
LVLQPIRARTQSLYWGAFAALALYAAFFVIYCWLDSAPRGWDEAFFLYHPTAVAKAFSEQGLAAAVRTFWRTPYHKPPLSMFGTLPFIVLFAGGSLAYRLDNLLVALAAGWFCYRFLQRRLPRELSLAFAFAVLVSPYAMNFARSEMAELYLWASTLWFLSVLLDGKPFDRWRDTLQLGLACACGLLSKTSFPVVVGVPALWVFARSLRQPGSGLLPRGLRAAAAAVLGAGTALPFYLKNWQGIRSHIALQWSWVGAEYRLGNPLSLAYLTRYFAEWRAWFGGLWIAFLALAVLLAAFFRLRTSRESAREPFREWPLVGGFVANALYFYFHPVFDIRYTLGSFICAQLAIALWLGRSLVAFQSARTALPAALALPSLVLLLSNSPLPTGTAHVLDWRLPLVGPEPAALGLPDETPDLRDAILDHLASDSSGELWIALAGDHVHLNNDNLRLRMLERGIRGDVMQLGYLPPKLSPLDRCRAAARAQLWVVIQTSPGGRPQAWPARHAEPVRELLTSRPDLFRRSSWVGDLKDGNRVEVYERIAPLRLQGDSL